MKQVITFSLYLFFYYNASSQDGLYSNLLFYKKNVLINPSDSNLYYPKPSGFYLYTNCWYQMRLSKHRMFYGRILSIKGDSLQLSSITHYNYFSEGTTYKPTWICANEIEKLIIPDPDKHNFEAIVNLKKYKYLTTKDSINRTFAVINQDRYASLAKTGIKYGTYRYNHPKFLEYKKLRPNESYREIENKHTYRWRDGIWLSPLHTNKINGLSTGFITGLDADLGYDDSTSHQIINGVNINADVTTILFTCGGAVYIAAYGIHYLFHKKEIDSINAAYKSRDTLCRQKKVEDKFDSATTSMRINGLSISPGVLGFANPDVNGLIINGLISTCHNINGVSINGLGTISNSFKGIQVAGIYNKAIRGKGLQIGIVNRCKDLKGVQIGFWNINSKRKLPLINWGK